jgi:pilus assembly protein CpaD
MRQPSMSLIVLAAALTLSACASSHRAQLTAATPTELWNDKVKVDKQPDTLLLGVHADGLSSTQAAAVAGFVNQWMQANGGDITVQAPVGASPRMIAGVQAALAAQGAPIGSILLASYDPAGDPAAPIVVAYDRYSVETPRCGTNWESLTRTRNNEVYNNFGCAVTANMAAQIANPEDLLHPRTMTPADAQRRATVLGKYRAGEVTSSARDDQAVGAISKAIN